MELNPLINAFQSGRNNFSTLLQAHVNFATWLASTDETAGEERLWQGEAGQSLATFIEDVDKVSNDLGSFDPMTYCDLFDEFLKGRVVPRRSEFSSRISIWDPLEARLQRADLLILGGLNENCWPAENGEDPWLSRTIRRRLKVPLLERRVGLAAHDFAQACAAPEVILTRAEKINGVPAVKSRWLSRLETLVGVPENDEAHRASTYIEWFRKLDSENIKQPLAPPNFAPPVYSRPRKLSVSDVENLIKNPYSILARYIFGLKPLDPLEEVPNSTKRGLLLHSALHKFLLVYPNDLPDDAVHQLLAIVRKELGALLEYPVVRIFWWPSIKRIVGQFVLMHLNQKKKGRLIATEKKGVYKFSSVAGDFTLTTKADRIDRMHNGKLAIIDYKTGSVPSWSKVESGYCPQLPLEGIIAQGAGYSGIAEIEVGEIAYWQLGASSQNGLWRYERSVGELLGSARLGLQALIESFDNPSTPYLSRPWPQEKGIFDQYEHLSRYKEWAAVDSVDTK